MTEHAPEERAQNDAENVTEPLPLWLHVMVPVGDEPVTVAVQAEGEPTATDDGTQMTEVVVAGSAGMVKVAEAVSAATEPTSLPDATTVYGPGMSDGTVKVQENVPADDVVWEVQVCVPGVEPAKVNVPIAVLTEKPVPVTVTEVPTGPDVAMRMIVGVVIVKVAEVITLLEVGSLTTTRPLLAPLVVTDLPPGMLPDESVVNWCAEEQTDAKPVDAS